MIQVDSFFIDQTQLQSKYVPLLHINIINISMYYSIQGYAKAGKILFDKAINSDTYYPIWGTCLGKSVCSDTTILLLVAHNVLTNI